MSQSWASSNLEVLVMSIDLEFWIMLIYVRLL